MRDAHNHLKRALINEAWFFSGPGEEGTVVDLACGRGGDLAKVPPVRHYIAVDCADLGLQELARRHREMKRTSDLRLIEGDAAYADIPTKSADIVMLNFALHYFTDTRDHLDCLLRTVSGALKEGGVFCGTCVDSNRVRTSPNATCEAWPSPDELERNPFGHRYRYTLGQCVDAFEYMIHTPTFVQMAHGHGLYLMKMRGFQEYSSSHDTPGGDLVDHCHSVFMFLKV